MAEERVEKDEDLVGEAGEAEKGVDVGVRSMSAASLCTGIFAGIDSIGGVGGL